MDPSSRPKLAADIHVPLPGPIFPKARQTTAHITPLGPPRSLHQMHSITTEMVPRSGLSDILGKKHRYLRSKTWIFRQGASEHARPRAVQHLKIRSENSRNPG